MGWFHGAYVSEMEAKRRSAQMKKGRKTTQVTSMRQPNLTRQLREMAAAKEKEVAHRRLPRSSHLSIRKTQHLHRRGSSPHAAAASPPGAPLSLDTNLPPTDARLAELVEGGGGSAAMLSACNDRGTPLSRYSHHRPPEKTRRHSVAIVNTPRVGLNALLFEIDDADLASAFTAAETPSTVMEEETDEDGSSATDRLAR